MGWNVSRLGASPLVEFEQNKAGSAAGPDFVTPVVTNVVEILLERRNHHTLGHCAEAGLTEMRATDRALDDDDALGIQEVYQIRDTTAEVAAHLFKDP